MSKKKKQPPKPKKEQKPPTLGVQVKEVVDTKDIFGKR